MKTFFAKWFATIAALALLLSVRAQDGNRPGADANFYDPVANPRTSIGDEVDQQQWYNPADWWDRPPAYNYYTDEFYNERTGQVGYHDYRSRSWNYPGSAWDDEGYWDDDWNDDLELDDWTGDFDWNDDEWWE